MNTREVIAEISRLSAENARLRAALTDIAEHGTRHDLIPTHVPGDEAFWHRYVRSMDDNVKNNASRALDEVSA